MKKFMKSLSLICLAVLMLCPLMLAGCARNYTIDISIAGGKGFVLEKGYEAKNVVGSNVVKDGEKFEYFIKPNTGYQIAKIVIDGEEWTEDYTRDETGTYLSFEEVDKNHTVVVTFEAIDRQVTLYCMGAGGMYEVYNRTFTTSAGVSVVNGVITVKHDSTLDLATNFAYGTGLGQVEWKLLKNGSSSAAAAEILISANRNLCTDLTATELDAILGA